MNPGAHAHAACETAIAIRVTFRNRTLRIDNTFAAEILENGEPRLEIRRVNFPAQINPARATHGLATNGLTFSASRAIAL